MNASSQNVNLLLILLLSVLAISTFILLPFLVPVFFAAVIAVVLHPLKKFMAIRLKIMPSVASLLTLLFAILIIGIPLTIFGFIIAGEANDVFQILTQGGPELSSPILFIESFVQKVFPSLGSDFNSFLKTGIDWVLKHFGRLFSQIFGALFNVLLSLIALFYFLRDGEKIINGAERYLPFKDGQVQLLSSKLKGGIKAVVNGALIVSLTQGVMATIGFAIFDIPNPALWGGVAFFTSFIPGFGTALVIAPLTAFLFITGNTGSALGLLIWGVTAVGLIDNILGPILIGKNAKLHPLLVLLSVLGGLKMFGFAGFLLGPIILSFLFATLSIYSEAHLTSKPA